jgi:hypothetical protein
VLTIEALGTAEDHLLLAGHRRSRASPARRRRRKIAAPARRAVPTSAGRTQRAAALAASAASAARAARREGNQRNLGYFDAEVQKLDAWADDLKGGLENEVKELDREIKDVRRTASVAATLEEKLHWQKRQRELEDKRNQLRRRIFDRQDDIDSQRGRLIAELEDGLSSELKIRDCFVVQWELT